MGVVCFDQYPRVAHSCGFLCLNNVSEIEGSVLEHCSVRNSPVTKAFRCERPETECGTVLAPHWTVVVQTEYSCSARIVVWKLFSKK
jgi:hypothetical protein